MSIPTPQRPRRSLGFWIISPWRHMMVSLWSIPMFSFALNTERIGLLLLSWLLAITADIVAAFRAPDSRMNHMDMQRLTEQGGSVYCITYREIWLKVAVIAAAVGYIVYVTYRKHQGMMELIDARYHIALTTMLVLAWISITGVTVRSGKQISEDEKPFAPDARYIKAKKIILILFAWPGFLYALHMFAAFASMFVLVDWSGSAALLMQWVAYFYGVYFFCCTLIPPAYALCKINPYVKHYHRS